MHFSEPLCLILGSQEVIALGILGVRWENILDGVN